MRGKEQELCSAETLSEYFMFTETPPAARRPPLPRHGDDTVFRPAGTTITHHLFEAAVPVPVPSCSINNGGWHAHSAAIISKLKKHVSDLGLDRLIDDN